VQTRDIWCERDDGAQVDGSLCSSLTPETTTACNEDACCAATTTMKSGMRCTGGTDDISNFHWTPSGFGSNTGSTADRDSCAKYCAKHAEGDGLDEYCCELFEEWLSTSVTYICALHITPQRMAWPHENSEGSYAALGSCQQP